MNESKDIFIEMQDHYERFLSMMLQRYICRISDGSFMIRSRSISFKKFDVLPMSAIITPEEVYHTYVEIDNNMLLNVKIYNT